MTFTVEIVGGPEDGKFMAVPDGTNCVYMAHATKPSAVYNEGLVTSMDPCYTRVELPIKLTRNGYKAYWREPHAAGS